jgi:S-layer protein
MAISTNGTVLARVAGALYNTQMSNATYAEVAALDPSTLTNALYARDFSMVTDATVATTLVTNLGLTSVAGLTNWVAAQLTAAGSNKGAKVVELLNGFAQMSSDATYGAAATAFNTKVDASLALSQTVGNKGGTFAAAGTVVPTPVTNASFNLTANADSFTGGAGDDTFNANIGAAAGVTTATTGDVLVGGAGTDTLKLTAVDAANPGLVQASGIENVNIRLLGAVTADALLIDGYQSFISEGSTSALTVNNAAIAATHGVKSSISGNAANLAVNFRGAEVAGTADVAKISLDNTGSSVIAAGATSATVTRVAVTVGAGAEGISLATAGTNYASVAGQTTTATLSVTGNGTNNIDIGTLKAASSIDASASTGTNTFNIGSSLTTGDSITGGAGADTVTFTADETATATMSGVETLQINGGTRTTTFSANPALTSLNVRSTDTTTIAGLTTLSSLNYQGTAAATYAGTSGNVSLNTAFAGTADALAVTVGNRGVTANGSYNAGTLQVSGVEGVTLTQSDMLATGTTTFSLKDTGLKTLAVTTAGTLALTLNTKADSAPLWSGTTASTTGSNTVTLVDFTGVAGSSSSITFDAGTFAAAATVKAAVGGSTFVSADETASDVITFEGGAGVDSFTTGTIGSYVATLGGGSSNTFNAGALVAAASGNTANVTGGDGADTITTGANADTIVGGAGDDIITGGKGADVINGGLGADTYRVAHGVAAVTAVNEVQTITPVANAGAGVADAASVLILVVAGKTVTVPVPALTAVDDLTPLIANALNAASGGAYSAVASATAVTVTHAASAGNVAPIQVKSGVDGTLTTIGTASTDTGSVTLGSGANVATKSTAINIATGTQGVAAAVATASDSPSTGMDQLTYVSNADIIDVVAGAIVITGGDAVTTAAAGNANISAAGLATFHADDDTLAERITAVAADLDAAAAVREAAVFVHAGQAYLYISNGAALNTDGDVLITLTGISTLANGITLSGGGDIIAIS